MSGFESEQEADSFGESIGLSMLMLRFNASTVNEADGDSRGEPKINMSLNSMGVKGMGIVISFC